MFIHFGWPVFGLYSGIFLVIYFAVTGWLYFREEAKSFFKKQERQEAGEEETPELAGAVAPERGMSNVRLDELDFGREDLQGALPDLLEELKWFFDQAAHDEVKRSELPGLLKPLLEPYAHLFSTHLPESICLHIASGCKEQLGYDLTEKELAKCLPETGKATGTGQRIAGVATVLLVLCSLLARAQDGNSGIQQATTMVKGYFDTGCTLMYAIGAVIGIVGAIKVYQKWNAGEPDTGKVAASWFGSCIFLVVVATVIKSFFGL
jgi:hypothetical protein